VRPRKSAQDSLFPTRSPAKPLAERMRPRELSELVGQEHLIGPGKLLSEMAAAKTLPSIILWGPPGSGKTTLANLLAAQSGGYFQSLSAVLTGVAELRDAIELARRELAAGGRATVLFVDEIHRWNKAQQDALLPHVESGLITLIGATTENPSFELIAPLLSRTKVLVLNPLSEEALARVVERALADRERGLGGLNLTLESHALRELVELAQGDARKALNTLELAAGLARQASQTVIEQLQVREANQHKGLRYDRAGEEHYNLISAFIKSMRGSDPDAALYWMARMLEGGEEPLFLARRMVIFASEDVGNADPRALSVALAIKEAVDFVGLPEAAITLAQGVTYLATAPKSNASYRALGAARADVKSQGALPVPMALRNAPTVLMRELGYGADYRYPHDYEGGVTAQDYMPEELRGRHYYEPSERGYEARIRELQEWVRARRAAGKD
jgi:putative ATPase